MTWSRLLIAACLLPALIVAGCGGDDDSAASDGQTKTTLSKADYIAQSDAICTKANASLSGLNLGLVSALRQGDFQGAASQVEAELARVRPLFDELLDLPVPPNDEQTLDELNDLRSQVLALVEGLVGAIRAEDVARIRSESRELAATGQRSREISAGYGFRACGQGQT